VSDLSNQVDRFENRENRQAGDLCTLWIGGNDLLGDAEADAPALADAIGAIIVLTGAAPDQLTLHSEYAGEPAWTVELSPSAGEAGFFQTRRP